MTGCEPTKLSLFPIEKRVNVAQWPSSMRGCHKCVKRLSPQWRPSGAVIQKCGAQHGSILKKNSLEHYSVSRDALNLERNLSTQSSSAMRMQECTNAQRDKCTNAPCTKNTKSINAS
jgi:hypothetical protein